MTKKDYITISNAIISVSEALQPDQIIALVSEMSFYLAKDNPSFDKAKFEKYIRDGIGRLEL
jgi:hypothetical protein